MHLRLIEIQVWNFTVLYQLQSAVDFELNPNLKFSSCPSPHLLLYLKFCEVKKLTIALLNPRLFPVKASELVSLPLNMRCINAGSVCRNATRDGNKWHCFYQPEGSFKLIMTLENYPKFSLQKL